MRKMFFLDRLPPTNKQIIYIILVLVKITISQTLTPGHPELTTELSPQIASDNIRGALGSLFILSQNLGYLVVYVAGDVLSFSAVLWLCTAVPAVFLVAFIAMPETPVFLVKQGKIKVRT